MKSVMRIAAVISLVAVGLAFTTTSFAKNKAPKSANFRGEIVSVDATANTIVAKNTKVESQGFTVTADTKIAVGAKTDATLADLKAGDKVMVVYVEDGGKLIAKKITKKEAK